MGARRKDPRDQNLRIRITKLFREQIEDVQGDSNIWIDKPLSEFMVYLMQIGIVRYENEFIPMERGIDIPPAPTPHPTSPRNAEKKPPKK